MTTSTGPRSVDQAVATTTSLGSLRDRRDWLINKFESHKARVATVTNVASGDWWVEWPDLSSTPEAPTVANQVELGINHWMSIGGAILPSIQVPMNKAADRRTEKGAVRKRQRRVKELWEASNLSETASMLWGDYAGAGSAVIGVWTNFEETDTAKRNPYIMRYDPRHTYLLKDNLGNITEMLVARKIDKAELAAMYPDWAPKFGDSKSEDVEEWFWYFKDRIVYALVDTSKDGRDKRRSHVIVDKEWDLGFVPAWEVTRPSFDGERRGVFDQSIHILRTMQRLMLMTILSTQEHAFPALGVFDVANPGDFGPGAILQYRSADSRIDRLGPQNHFDVKDLVARLGEEGKQQSVLPQQLMGEPGASIVSARGINASMGALDARLALAHKQFETGMGKASGFLLAFDEVFCGGEKTIVGDMRDTSKAETYNPETDVAGAWVVNCTYGIGAGSDPANIEVRLNMNLSAGLISRETARHQLPFLQDPDAEPVLQFREAMQDSIVTGIMAMSEQGDPSVAAKAMSLVRSDDVDFDQVMEQLVELLTAPPEAPPGGGGDPALESLQGAESLARGGIPGNAEQAPPGGGLPGLGAILGQDSRQIS